MSAGAPLKLAILISGRGSNMSAIVRACLAGAISARSGHVGSHAHRREAAGTIPYALSATRLTRTARAHRT